MLSESQIGRIVTAIDDFNMLKVDYDIIVESATIEIGDDAKVYIAYRNNQFLVDL